VLNHALETLIKYQFSTTSFTNVFAFKPCLATGLAIVTQQSTSAYIKELRVHALNEAFA